MLGSDPAGFVVYIQPALLNVSHGRDYANGLGAPDFYPLGVWGPASTCPSWASYQPMEVFRI